MRKVRKAAMDGRSRVSRELLRWRDELILECGGEAISARQLALVDAAARTLSLLRAIDEFLLGLGPRIVDRKRRRLCDAIQQRQQLNDSLVKTLNALNALAPVNAGAPPVVRQPPESYVGAIRQALGFDDQPTQPKSEQERDTHDS